MIKNQKKYKSENGISLIILAVTIIIMFLLAGTTINMVAGDEGFLEQSQETQNMQKDHVINEDTIVNNLINKVNEETENDWQDGSKANKPKLSSEMVPVKWNGENWIVTNKKDTEWFNYTEKKWANVMLRDGLVVEGIENAETAHLDTMQGKKVTKLGSMFVWIPRFGYQILTGYHQSGADINTENPELGAGKINIEFLVGTTDVGVNETVTWNNKSGKGNWNVHPAFNYNGAVEGIWVAKFEASRMDANSSSTGTSNVFKIQPGVQSWKNITVNDIYINCLNYNTTLNSHMMKNSEWGAVAYLAQSVYGKNSEIWINPNSNYITGQAGESVSAETTTETYSYETENGVQASTTGNIYGIYDMSGGASEYVAAYINNESSNLSNGENLVGGKNYTKDVYNIGETDTETLNYAANSGKYGDAIYETSLEGQGSTAWYEDYSQFSYSDNLFLRRGGNCDDTTHAGTFYFYNHDGSGYDYIGFRPVLIVT